MCLAGICRYYDVFMQVKELGNDPEKFGLKLREFMHFQASPRLLRASEASSEHSSVPRSTQPSLRNRTQFFSAFSPDLLRASEPSSEHPPSLGAFSRASATEHRKLSAFSPDLLRASEQTFVFAPRHLRGTLRALEHAKLVEFPILYK